MNKKVQKLLEELGSEAAKPVATEHKKGTALKVKFSNSKVYPADQHEQAEEVEEVIVESALTEFLVKELDHYLELEGSVDEVLNEGIGNFLKWKLLKYSVKFIDEDSLDEIIEASGSEVPASKILKIKKVRSIMEKVPSEERSKFYQSSALQKAESLYSKGKATKVAGGVTTAVGGIGAGVALGSAASKASSAASKMKQADDVSKTASGALDLIWNGSRSTVGKLTAEAEKLTSQAGLLTQLGLVAGAVAVAGLLAFGIGAAISSRVKKNIRVDVSEVKDYLGSKKQSLKESYTREDLEVLFESLNLDTHKYTFEYLAEELGFAAAKPVHGSGEAKEHTPEFSNSDIYPADEHEQAEEVEEVIVESYTREDLEELFESLQLDTDKYTFEYLAEELGFQTLNELSPETRNAAVKARKKQELDAYVDLYKTPEYQAKEKHFNKKPLMYKLSGGDKKYKELIDKSKSTPEREKYTKAVENMKKTRGLADKLNKRDAEVVKESYTREDLEELFESLQLDTDKYTFEYLAEELGFEQK